MGSAMTWGRGSPTQPIRRPTAVVLALLLLVASAACTDDADRTDAADHPPADPVDPTSLRTIDGPWPASATSESGTRFGAFVAALGNDRVLAGFALGAHAGSDPSDDQFVVGDLGEETWTPIDAIPDDGAHLYSRIRGERGVLDAVSLEGDVFVLGSRCRDLNTATEEEPVCVDPGDIELWRFHAVDLEWQQMMDAPPDELTGSSGWPLSYLLGVVDGELWYRLEPPRGGPTSIVAIDPASGAHELVDRYDAIDHQGVSALCTTASGLVVGTAAARLATLQPQEGWRLHDDVPFDPDLDHLACADDSAFLFVDERRQPSLRWREIDGDGVVVADEPLPEVAAMTAHLPCTFGWPVDQYTVALGDEIGFVRDFGDQAEEIEPTPDGLHVVGDIRVMEATDSGRACADVPLEPHRQVVVVPRLGADPLVEDYPVDEGYVSVLDAARLPDGRIVVLVERSAPSSGGERTAADPGVRTELLIAE